MFEKELQFFIANQADLVAKFQGKVLIIKGDQIVGAYASPLDAYLEAKNRRFADGTYMLQPCEPGPSAYTVTLACI